MADPRLRREMDHVGKAAVAKERGGSLRVREVDVREAEPRMREQSREPRLLQRDVVIGIQIVGAGDGDTVREQALRNMHADETGGAGDEHVPRVLRAAHLPCPACSARSFAYLRKLFWQPIATWTRPGTPSRKPSFRK